MITNSIRIPKILLRTSGAKFFLFLFAGLSLGFMSCNESSVVGLDVQPKNDLLHVGYIDTTTLATRTVREDSLRTDESLLSDGTILLGKYEDPFFGEATASVYTQLSLSANITPTSFGTTPVCDSIVLSLAYNAAYYGKTGRVQQTVNVRQIVDDILISTKYSNKTANTSSLDLASAHNFMPRPTDSVTVKGVRLKPQLRIPLDVNFGQVLLNNQTTGNLANNSAFQTFMKGLYITTENTTTLTNPGDGNILSFNVGGSAMTIYYHYTGQTLICPNKPVATDSIISTYYDFSIAGARFLHFSHKFPTIGPLADQLLATPPAQNDVVFIQSISGVKTKIDMPSLMHWIDGGPIAINKAELVIKADMTPATSPFPAYGIDTFSVPTTLIVFGINDDGTNFILPDAFEGSNYFGGVYNANTTGEYHFNITRYIQQILDKTIHNNGMFLLATGGAVNASRVAIGGGGSTSSYRMKLNIVSTKLH